jgi:hypothetical protein
VLNRPPGASATRQRTVRQPPPALVQARVLKYAVLPRSIPFVQTNSLFVGSKSLGRVPRVAICQEANGQILLLFCDSSWGHRASATQDSLLSAKARVERMYPGSSKHWVDAKVTKARAAQYLQRVWAKHRCNFCLKTPLEQNHPVFRKGRGQICGACITELAQDLSEAS